MAKVLVSPLFAPKLRVYPNGTRRSTFIFCVVCGAQGLPGGRWLDNCIKNSEHTHRCSCGRRYPSRGAVAAHIRAEARWRPEDRHDAL